MNHSAPGRYPAGELEDGIVLVVGEPAAIFTEAALCVTDYLARWPDRDFVWDVTALDFASFSQANVRALIERLSGIVPAARQGRRTAVVVPSDVGYGLMRMLAALAEGRLPTTVQVFRAREQALAWLREDAGPAADPAGA